MNFARGKTAGSLLFITLLVSCLWSFPNRKAVAAPALAEAFQLTQPNGAQFRARQHGDEWLNWISHQGLVVQQGDDGWWRYAVVAGGDIVAADSIRFGQIVLVMGKFSCGTVE